MKWQPSHALTDVTGFGLGGHLREMCEGSGVQAVIQFDQVPVLPHIPQYLELDCSPGGAKRNFDSYGYALGEMSERQRQIICDPQTSGGLLVALDPAGEADFLSVCRAGRAGFAAHRLFTRTCCRQPTDYGGIMTCHYLKEIGKDLPLVEDLHSLFLQDMPLLDVRAPVEFHGRRVPQQPPTAR